MTGPSEPKLHWVGRTLQKLGCLPNEPTTNTQVHYYPIAILPVDGGPDYDYSGDIKFKPGPRFPPPQPDKPKPQMSPHVYQQVPKNPKKTPIAQTVPLSTLPSTYQQKPLPIPKDSKTPVAQTMPLSTLSLPANLPGLTPAPTSATLNPSPAPPTIRINQTPHLIARAVIPQTPSPDQSTVPGSILPDLGNIPPNQYTWNIPHGSLTYTPAPTSTLHLPDTLANPGSSSSSIIDVGDGDDKPRGLGLIPSIISSDSSDSSDSSSDDHQSEFALNPLLAALIEWNVSEPIDRVRYVLNDADLTANAIEPATNPPTNTLSVELHFLDHPGVKWNWEPITIRKHRPVRISDVFHGIHDYFQTQLTHGEYDIIKSYGKANGRIVRDSWRERLYSQQGGEAQSVVYNGGLRRVDCLGASKNFAGFCVDGSQLKLRLRA